MGVCVSKQSISPTSTRDAKEEIKQGNKYEVQQTKHTSSSEPNSPSRSGSTTEQSDKILDPSTSDTGVESDYQSLDMSSEFARTMWLQNTIESLKQILKGPGRPYFTEFLKAEFNENHLEFYDEVEELKKAAHENGGSVQVKELEKKTRNLFNRFMKTGAEDEVNISSRIRQKGVQQVSVDVLLEAQQEVIRMLALDCFPRFVRSKYCKDMMIGVTDGALRTSVKKTQAAAPTTRGQWLEMFKAAASLLPACIVIADMKLPDIPMVFVNESFLATTGYLREEVEGRNCRFLQGPETDPQAIQLLRTAIHDHDEVHVDILNYRKNGEPFQNLLSMKPVFNDKEECEYFIGVQYEVSDVNMMVTRLVQHDQLLKLLPSHITLSSN